MDSNIPNDQPKINAELNRPGGRVESAGNLAHCVDDADRPRGNITGEAEFDDERKTSV